ncbi:MAG: hypothetical protein QXF01_00170 [Candidatus Micrarchaeaceae archaeon]
MKNADLDSTIDALEALEERDRGETAHAGAVQQRVSIGIVEVFFGKISVAAVRLTGQLKVGDLIEIGTEDEAIRQRVSSMQINHSEVGEAGEGDSVGIKLKYKVEAGQQVYKLLAR